MSPCLCFPRPVSNRRHPVEICLSRFLLMCRTDLCRRLTRDAVAFRTLPITLTHRRQTDGRRCHQTARQTAHFGTIDFALQSVQDGFVTEPRVQTSNPAQGPPSDTPSSTACQLVRHIVSGVLSVTVSVANSLTFELGLFVRRHDWQVQTVITLRRFRAFTRPC
jgi:hypothetical protein